MTKPSKTTAARTRTGLDGGENEDRFIIKEIGGGGLMMAVADGLGGNVSGGYAADIIIDHLVAIDQVEPGKELSTLSTLVKAVDIEIGRHQAERSGLEGTGSTLVCVLLRDDTAYWAHVGDSRLYLFREGELHQITEDQTLSRFLIEEGDLSPEEAPTHYSRHVMDQFVGCGFAHPETGYFGVRSGDLLALATDGLHKPITTGTLKVVLGGSDNLNQITEKLIAAALESGGQDDMTIILARV